MNGVDDKKDKIEQLKKEAEAKEKEEEEKKALPVFSDEEYLIASPVVLGFAFAEKLYGLNSPCQASKISHGTRALMTLLCWRTTRRILSR